MEISDFINLANAIEVQKNDLTDCWNIIGRIRMLIDMAVVDDATVIQGIKDILAENFS